MKKTIDIYQLELSNIETTFICLSDSYIDTHHPIKHQCKLCLKIFDISPMTVLRGGGCRYCNGGVKITHEDYISKLERIESDYRPLVQYVNSKTLIHHECKSCKNIKKFAPKECLKFKECKCKRKRKKKLDNTIYLSELSRLNISHKPLELYNGNSTKINHQCSNCKHIWKVTPYHILNNSGCPNCDRTRTMTNDEYLERLSNRNIQPLEIYVNSYTKIKHKCLTCDYIWNKKPGEILHNKTGCPNCNMSKGETYIKNYLTNNNILFETQKTYDNLKLKSLLRFDFYLPDKNLLIEYNGIQHSKPIDFFGGTQSFIDINDSDKLKLGYCSENKLDLLIIDYTEIDRIKEILNRKLL